MEGTPPAHAQHLASSQGDNPGQQQPPPVFTHPGNSLQMSAGSYVVQPPCSMSMQGYSMGPPPATSTQGLYPPTHQQQQNYSAAQMAIMYRSPIPSVLMQSQQAAMQQQFLQQQQQHIPTTASNKNQYGFPHNPGGYRFPYGGASDYQYLPASTSVSPEQRKAVRANFSPTNGNLNVHVPTVTPGDQGQTQGQTGDVNTQVQAAVQGAIQSAYGSLMNANVMNSTMGRDINLNVHVHVHSNEQETTPALQEDRFAPNPNDPILQDPALRAMINFSSAKPPRIKAPKDAIVIIDSSDDEEIKKESDGDSLSGRQDNEPSTWQNSPGVDANQFLLVGQKKKPAFQCQTCLKVFNNKRGLDNHIKLKHKKQTIQTNQQGATGDLRSESVDHGDTSEILSSPKKRTNSFNCSLCEKQLNNRKGLMCHLRKKHKLKIDHIEDTESVMKRKEKESSLSDQPSKTRIYATPVKEVTRFSRQENGTKATRDSSESSKQPYQCPICDKGYKLKIALTKHIRSNHESSSKSSISENESANNADISDVKGTDNDSTAIGSGPDRLECSICSRLCDTESELTEHVKNHYTVRKNQSQAKGDGSSNKKGPAKQQMKEMSESENMEASRGRYSCELCVNKSFRLRKALEVHMKKKHNITRSDSDTEEYDVSGYLLSTTSDNNLITSAKSNRSTARNTLRSTSPKSRRSTTPMSRRSMSPSRSRRSSTPMSRRSTSPPMSRRSSTTNSETTEVYSSQTRSSRNSNYNRNTRRGRTIGLRAGVATRSKNPAHKRVKYDDESTKELGTSSDEEYAQDLECYVCGYTFTDPRKLRRHIRLEHGSDNSDVDSDYRPKVDVRFNAARRDRPRRDLNRNAEPIDYKFVARKPMCCQYCKKVFRRDITLAKHESMCSEGPINSSENMSGATGITAVQIKSSRSKSSPNYPKDESPVTNNGSAKYTLLDCSIKLHRVVIDDTLGNSSIKCSDHHKTVKRLNETKSQSKYYCEVCYKCFRSLVKFNKHVESIHPQVYTFTCQFCSLRFQKQHKLKSHERSHDPKSPYQCLNCMVSFETKQKLFQHKRKEHHQVQDIQIAAKKTESIPKLPAPQLQQDDETYPCPQCFKPFTKYANMYKHMKNVHSKNIACLLCKNEFTDKGALNIHIRQSHPDEFPFECKLCYQRWRFEIRFSKHVRFHKNKYKCLVCALRFEDKDSLDAHIRSLHNPALIPRSETHADENTKLSCNLCNVHFLTRSTLNQHMAKRHNECIAEVCNHCKRTLKNKLTLMKHLAKKHKHLFPYGCRFCEKRFAIDKFQAYKQHKMTHKNNVKPYYCIVCQCAFKSKHGYSTHVSKHTTRTKSDTADDKMKNKKTDNQQDSTSAKMQNLMDKSRGKAEGESSEQDEPSSNARLFCDVCNREFKRAKLYTRHMKLHNGIASRNQEQRTAVQSETGTESGKPPDSEELKTENFSNQKQDSSAHKRKSDPLCCSICSMSFTSPLTKLMHEATHWVKNKFECNKCSFKCDDETKLETHVCDKHQEMEASVICDDKMETVTEKESSNEIDTSGTGIQNIIVSPDNKGDSQTKKTGKSCEEIDLHNKFDNEEKENAISEAQSKTDDLSTDDSQSLKTRKMKTSHVVTAIDLRGFSVNEVITMSDKGEIEETIDVATSCTDSSKSTTSGTEASSSSEPTGTPTDGSNTHPDNSTPFKTSNKSSSDTTSIDERPKEKICDMEETQDKPLNMAVENEQAPNNPIHDKEKSDKSGHGLECSNRGISGELASTDCEDALPIGLLDQGLQLPVDDDVLDALSDCEMKEKKPTNDEVVMNDNDSNVRSVDADTGGITISKAHVSEKSSSADMNTECALNIQHTVSTTANEPSSSNSISFDVNSALEMLGSLISATVTKKMKPATCSAPVSSCDKISVSSTSHSSHSTTNAKRDTMSEYLKKTPLDENRKESMGPKKGVCIVKDTACSSDAIQSGVREETVEKSSKSLSTLPETSATTAATAKHSLQVSSEGENSSGDITDVLSKPTSPTDVSSSFVNRSDTSPDEATVASVSTPSAPAAQRGVALSSAVSIQDHERLTAPASREINSIPDSRIGKEMKSSNGSLLLEYPRGVGSSSEIDPENSEKLNYRETVDHIDISASICVSQKETASDTCQSMRKHQIPNTSGNENQSAMSSNKRDSQRDFSRSKHRDSERDSPLDSKQVKSVIDGGKTCENSGQNNNIKDTTTKERVKMSWSSVTFLDKK